MVWLPFCGILPFHPLSLAIHPITLLAWDFIVGISLHSSLHLVVLILFILTVATNAVFQNVFHCQFYSGSNGVPWFSSKIDFVVKTSQKLIWFVVLTFEVKRNQNLIWFDFFFLLLISFDFWLAKEVKTTCYYLVKKSQKIKSCHTKSKVVNQSQSWFPLTVKKSKPFNHCDFKIWNLSNGVFPEIALPRWTHPYSLIVLLKLVVTLSYDRNIAS